MLRHETCGPSSCRRKLRTEPSLVAIPSRRATIASPETPRRERSPVLATKPPTSKTQQRSGGGSWRRRGTLTRTRTVQRMRLVTRKGGANCDPGWGQGMSRLFCLSDDEDEEEDETAELLRELEKIKKERAEQREREVSESRDADFQRAPPPRLTFSPWSRREKRPLRTRRDENTTLLVATRC